MKNLSLSISFNTFHNIILSNLRAQSAFIPILESAFLPVLFWLLLELKSVSLRSEASLLPRCHYLSKTYGGISSHCHQDFSCILYRMNILGRKITEHIKIANVLNLLGKIEDEMAL